MSIRDLEEVGEVLHLAKSSRIIVRTFSAKSMEIRPGEVLVDERNRAVGKVAEMIGPVLSPYASLFPLTDRSNKILGVKVYRRKLARAKRKH